MDAIFIEPIGFHLSVLVGSYAFVVMTLTLLEWAVRRCRLAKKRRSLKGDSSRFTFWHKGSKL